MAKKYLIILIFLLPLISFSQSSDFFIYTSGTVSMSIDTSVGGGYYTNNIDYYPIGNDFIISKIREDGTINWQYHNQQFDGSDSSNKLYMIKSTFDGGVIGVGNIKINQFPNVYNCLITYIDSNGYLKWQKEYNLGFLEFPKAIYADSDSTFIIACLIDNDLVTIKINSQGDSLWSNRKVFTTSYLMDVNYIQKIDNSYFYFGQQFDTTSINFYWQGIYKIDSVGNFVWEKIFYDSASAIYPLDARATQNGELLSFNSMLTNSNTTFQQINRYDVQGNLIGKYFPDLYGGFASDTSICGIYNKTTVSSDTGFVGLKIFETNDINDFAYFFYNNSGISYLSDFLIDRNGSVLISGRIDPMGFGNVPFLAKYSDTLSIGIKELELGHAFTIFPNPSNSIVNIKVDEAFLNEVQPYSLKIYNQFGEICYHFENLSNNLIQINFSDLGAGLYFYTLTTNQTKIEAGKLIINRTSK